MNISYVAGSSTTPGLQNQGQISGTAYISGVLNPTGTDGTTSNLTGYFTITLPDPSVISSFMVNLPGASNQLITNWFPLIGTVELTDNTQGWRLVMFIQSSSLGRQINVNFVSLTTTSTTNFASFPINIIGHLYSYPWQE